MIGMKHIVKQFFQRDAHPVIQFIKYAIAGGIATVVDIGIFYLLAWKVLPALTPADPLVKLLHLPVTVIEESIRSTRFLVDRAITFIFSNLTAYIVNVLWVFHPGRHSRWMEFLLFYLVSITSFAVGTSLGWALIKYAGMTTSVAYLANLVASLMINYVCRKFLVFKG